MAMDHEGNRIINEGLKEDLVKLRSRIQKEVEEKYQKQWSNILGSAKMQADAQEDLRKKMDHEVNQRYLQGAAQLEKMAFGEQGKQHAYEMAKKEQQIDDFQAKRRKEQEKGNTQVNERGKLSYTTTHKFNQPNQDEKNFQQAKDRLSERKGHDIPQSGMNADFNQQRQRTMGQEWAHQSKEETKELSESEKQQLREAKLQEWREADAAKDRNKDPDQDIDV